MQFGAVFAPILSCFFLAACSTHPLVNERTGLSAADIVRKIRCEAKEAFTPFAEKASYRTKRDAYKTAKEDFKTLQGLAEENLTKILNQLLKGEIDRQEYYNKKWHQLLALTAEENKLLKVENDYFEFAKQAVAYQFTFTASETNFKDGNVGLTWPLHFGTATIGAFANENRTRSADRVVAAADKVEDLMEIKDCDKVIYEASLRYPITGKIGLEETVDQYFRIKKMTSLDIAKAAYQDTLKYTVDLISGADASISLSPSRARTIKAGFGFDATRKDVQELIIKFTPYPAKTLKDDPELELVNVADVRVREGGRQAFSPEALPDAGGGSRGISGNAGRMVIQQRLPRKSEEALDREILDRALRELNERQKLDTDKQLQDFLDNR